MGERGGRWGCPDQTTDVRPLSERERVLLHLRHPPVGARRRTLAEVGRVLGVSPPRVAQMHDRALNALARIALAVQLHRPVPADARADLTSFGHLLRGSPASAIAHAGGAGSVRGAAPGP